MLTCCRALNVMGREESLACQAYPDTGTGTSEDVFYLRAIRGPTRSEGKPGIKPGSSDPQSSPLLLRHRGGLRSFDWKSMCNKFHHIHTNHIGWFSATSRRDFNRGPGIYRPSFLATFDYPYYFFGYHIFGRGIAIENGIIKNVIKYFGLIRPFCSKNKVETCVHNIYVQKVIVSNTFVYNVCNANKSYICTFLVYVHV